MQLQIIIPNNGLPKYIRNQPNHKTVDFTKDSRETTKVVKIRSAYFVQFNLASSLKIKKIRVEKLKITKHNTTSYFNTGLQASIFSKQVG